MWIHMLLQVFHLALKWECKFWIVGTSCGFVTLSGGEELTRRWVALTHSPCFYLTGLHLHLPPPKTCPVMLLPRRWVLDNVMQPVEFLFCYFWLQGDVFQVTLFFSLFFFLFLCFFGFFFLFVWSSHLEGRSWLFPGIEACVKIS